MSALTLKGSAMPRAAAEHLMRPAPGVIATLFFGYLAVGLPLSVLPLFIHAGLGFGDVTVGLVIGVQFLATVITRSYAGRVTDIHGGKRAALQGAVLCTAGGFAYLVAISAPFPSVERLTILIVGRVASGCGESQFVTGCVSWSIASVGPKRAGKSMSWTGIAMFAALAIGAPIGLALSYTIGLAATAAACMSAPLVAIGIARRTTPYTSPSGHRMPFHRVVGQIWREGLGLMLQGVGLSGLTAFASLYFAARGWTHAGLVMTSFGVGFIFVRIVLGHLPDNMSGYCVARWSLIVEAFGQVMIWWAPGEIYALTGAMVTGLGCALVYPALGVEALKHVLPANRASAMGAFVAFLDISYGVAGPAAGLIACQFGYGAIFLLGSSCALLGATLTLTGRSFAR